MSKRAQIMMNGKSKCLEESSIQFQYDFPMRNHSSRRSSFSVSSSCAMSAVNSSAFSSSSGCGGGRLTTQTETRFLRKFKTQEFIMFLLLLSVLKIFVVPLIKY